LSTTVTVSFAVPSFVTLIVYVISSPSFTLLPLTGSEIFPYFMSAFFTSTVTSDSSSSTVALFNIVFSNLAKSSPSSAFIFALKVSLVSLLAATLTVIPSFRASILL